MVERCAGWADRLTGCVLAVLALHRKEPALLALPLGQDTDEAFTVWQVVPLSTCLLTGTAADTLVQIDDQDIVAFGLGSG
jgi:hypothetical protein